MKNVLEFVKNNANHDLGFNKSVQNVIFGENQQRTIFNFFYQGLKQTIFDHLQSSQLLNLNLLSKGLISYVLL